MSFPYEKKKIRGKRQDLDLCTERENPLCELSTSPELELINGINSIIEPALKYSSAVTLLGLLAEPLEGRNLKKKIKN